VRLFRVQTATTDAEGNLGAKFTVAAAITGFGNGPIDCTVAPGCALAVLTDEPVITNQLTPLSFDLPDNPISRSTG